VVRCHMKHKKLSGREEASFFHASVGGMTPSQRNRGLVYVAYSAARPVLPLFC